MPTIPIISQRELDQLNARLQSLEQELAGVRKATIEECAEVCDAQQRAQDEVVDQDITCEVAKICAIAIRAIAENERKKSG